MITSTNLNDFRKECAFEDPILYTYETLQKTPCIEDPPFLFKGGRSCIFEVCHIHPAVKILPQKTPVVQVFLDPFSRWWFSQICFLCSPETLGNMDPN